MNEADFHPAQQFIAVIVEAFLKLGHERVPYVVDFIGVAEQKREFHYACR